MAEYHVEGKDFPVVRSGRYPGVLNHAVPDDRLGAIAAMLEGRAHASVCWVCRGRRRVLVGPKSNRGQRPELIGVRIPCPRCTTEGAELVKDEA